MSYQIELTNEANDFIHTIQRTTEKINRLSGCDERGVQLWERSHAYAQLGKFLYNELVRQGLEKT